MYSNLIIFYVPKVSYARKFDNLKKQLIEANGSKGGKDTSGNAVGGGKQTASDLFMTAKPSVAVVYYPNSAVPKYDLVCPCICIFDLPSMSPFFRGKVSTFYLLRKFWYCSIESTYGFTEKRVSYKLFIVKS